MIAAGSSTAAAGSLCILPKKRSGSQAQAEGSEKLQGNYLVAAIGQDGPNLWNSDLLVFSGLGFFGWRPWGCLWPLLLLLLLAPYAAAPVSYHNGSQLSERGGF